MQDSVSGREREGKGERDDRKRREREREGEGEDKYRTGVKETETKAKTKTDRHRHKQIDRQKSHEQTNRQSETNKTELYHLDRGLRIRGVRESTKKGEGEKTRICRPMELGQCNA